MDPEVMTDIQDQGDLLALKGTGERREYPVMVASTLLVIEESQETMEDLALLANRGFRAITGTKEPAERLEKRATEVPPATPDQRVYKETACKDQRAQRERLDPKVKSAIPGSRPFLSCLQRRSKFRVKGDPREKREKLENGENEVHVD